MSRGTFRRYVEADAREQRTLKHIKLAQERKVKALDNAHRSIEGNSGNLPSEKQFTEENGSGIPQSALDEFRIMREFPTLLKIISSQAINTFKQNLSTAKSTAVIDTAPYSEPFGKRAVNSTGSGSSNVRKSPILCIDTISAVPNTNASGARVPVQYGDFVRMRSQRSYLQGLIPVQSDNLLTPSSHLYARQSLGTVTSVPRLVPNVDKRRPDALATVADVVDKRDLEDGLVWRIESADTMDRSEEVRFGQQFHLVLVGSPGAVLQYQDDEEESSKPDNMSTRYLLCASVDSALSRSSSRTSSRPSSRPAAERARTQEGSRTKTKDMNIEDTSAHELRVFLCAEDDPRCNTASSAWSFSGSATGKVVLAERHVCVQSMYCSESVPLVDLLTSAESRSVSAAFLCCPTFEPEYVSAVIDKKDPALSESGVPTNRDAAFNWFVEPLSKSKLDALGMIAPVECQNEQETTGKGTASPLKQRKRTFRGRSPSKPLPSPPATIELDNLNDNRVQNSGQYTQYQSPRSRRIARTAASSNSGQRGKTFGGHKTPVVKQSSSMKMHTQKDTSKLKDRPPFTPCSPYQARDTISRKNKNISVSIDVPYSALSEKLKAETKVHNLKRLAGDFKAAVPCSTHNRYVDRSGQFLHSPDRRCVKMEQDFLKARARRGLKLLEERAMRSKKRWAKTKAAREDLEHRY